MLYDPKWSKSKPCLDDLIAWLEEQDLNTTYDWFDPRGCLVYNYLASKGMTLHDLPYENVFPGETKAIIMGHMVRP
jgi:hypothetical protein